MTHDQVAARLEQEVQQLRERVDELEAALAARGPAPAAEESPFYEEASFRKSIIARAAEGLCVCHAVEEYPNVRFTVWNDRMTEITGYTLAQINELGWYQTVYPNPEVSARAMARMDLMREGRDLIAEEWEITRADGQRRVLSISTSLLQAADGQGHVLGLMQDVTERRQAEEALRQSEERYRMTLEQVPVGIVNAAPDGTLVHVNPHLCQLIGYSAEELIGGADRVFIHPDDLSVLEEQIPALSRREVDRVAMELRLLHRAGHVVWVQMTVTEAHDDAGELFSRISVVQDISELKAAQAERLRLQEQMQNAQKLESLGVLAGGIAHDFNNLLCGMLGSADLALYDLEPQHPAVESVEMVRETAQRATELCRQMLAYSGKGRFVVEPIDITKLIAGMTQLLAVSVAKKAALRFELASALPAVEADATQLRQIVLNLVVNASDALGARPGTITVATGVLHCERSYLRSTYLDENLPAGEYAFLEVTDTGCGMDDATRERIFDPFFTTKFAGRGLGLAATLGIVRGHRGAVKVYSEEGQGSTIKILLPTSERVVVTSRVVGSDENWRGSGAVLLVDDEPAVRTVGRRMLERLGFSVLLAEDGEQGVAMFRAHQAEITLVILDMTMPRLGGEETFRELRQLDPGIRVVLTSGYNEQEATNRFAGKGLAGFLQKPLQLGTLRLKLRELLEED